MFNSNKKIVDNIKLHHYQEEILKLQEKIKINYRSCSASDKKKLKENNMLYSEIFNLIGKANEIKHEENKKYLEDKIRLLGKTLEDNFDNEDNLKSIINSLKEFSFEYYIHSTKTKLTFQELREKYKNKTFEGGNQ